MHVLIVLTHPDPNSLTASIAGTLLEELSAEHTVELADLNAEGFAPSFSLEDLAAYRLHAPAPDDVRREQERVERADAIVFVHPIYWWGIPALLKGWIDRVFSIGWAWGQGTDKDDNGRALVGKRIHLVGLGASSQASYNKRGVLDAMHRSINEGTFEYCSAPVTSARILHESEGDLAERDLFVAATVNDVLESLQEKQYDGTAVV